MSLSSSNAFPHYNRIVMAADDPPQKWVRDAKAWRHYAPERLDKKHPSVRQRKSVPV